MIALERYLLLLSRECSVEGGIGRIDALLHVLFCLKLVVFGHGAVTLQLLDVAPYLVAYRAKRSAHLLNFFFSEFEERRGAPR